MKQPTKMPRGHLPLSIKLGTVCTWKPQHTLDSAAMEAKGREPGTPAEWATFFKFYVDHMEDGLHEVMMTKVSGGVIT